MPRRHRHCISVTLKVALLVASILMLSFCETTMAAMAEFGPPSNVAAEINPNMAKYDLRRIGIITFVNRSGTPDAGIRVAHFFFDELTTHRRFEVTPPLVLDEATELAFTRIAESAPIEEHPDRLQRFVRDWIGRVWPSPATPPEMGQEQTQSRAESPPPPSPPMDAVLTGVIIRYEDRQGSALAVDRPASVAYDAYLISARDGEMLWRARFDETQRPLLDNLLLIGRFLHGGGVWQSSDTLARIGLERVLETFPGIARRALP
jgi:hypothetical protein